MTTVFTYEANITGTCFTGMTVIPANKQLTELNEHNAVVAHSVFCLVHPINHAPFMFMIKCT